MKQTIKVANVDVHIEGTGDHTIVMLHGWPDTYRIWDAQIEPLADHYRCVRFSWPGFETGTPRKLLDLEQILATLDAVIDAVSNDKPITLMLHDWGCLYGYQYLIRNKDKVAHIIGVDIGDAGSRDMVLPFSAKLGMLAYQLWLMAAWNIGGRSGNWMTKKLAAAFKAPTPLTQIHSGMNYPYHWFWRSALTGKPNGMKRVTIDVPLLFFFGANKAANFHSDAWQKRMAAIDGNQVIELPTGHWVMVEAPDEFNKAVLHWLNTKLSK